MKFNVTLLNNNEKRYYLIEITDEVTVWSVEKRFQELYLLKEALSNRFNYKFNRFPKRLLFNSYRSDILQKRLQSISHFLATIGELDFMVNSDLFQNFIRSNIYLETYENIRQADLIRDSFIKSKELQLKVNGVLDDCYLLEDEITALGDKNQILIKNIKDVEAKNQANLNLFVEAKQLKLASSREKNQSIQHFKDLDELYIQLKRQIVLVNVLKSSTVERLNNLRDNTVELEGDLLAVHNLVETISDPVLKHKFYLAEYQAINKLYLDKITKQLSKMSPKISK